MFAALAKYHHAFLLGLQSNLVYRWTFGIRAFFSLFHLVFVFILWSAAYRGQTEIGGFALGETLTYFVVLMIMQFFIGASTRTTRSARKSGTDLIKPVLLKPINYYGYRFSIFVAARLVSGVLALLPLLVRPALLHEYLVFPSDPWRLALGVPAAFMAAADPVHHRLLFRPADVLVLEIQSFVILSLASKPCWADRCSRST